MGAGMTLSELDRRLLRRAHEQAKLGFDEGGCPIGSVLARGETVLGEGRNRRVQEGDPIAHGEMDALRRAGRQASYAGTTIYTTLSPCMMCSGTIVQFGIPRVVIGENANFGGNEEFLRSRGVEVIVADDDACRALMARFVTEKSPRPMSDRCRAARPSSISSSPASAASPSTGGLRCLHDRGGGRDGAAPEGGRDRHRLGWRDVEDQLRDLCEGPLYRLFRRQPAQRAGRSEDVSELPERLADDGGTPKYARPMCTGEVRSKGQGELGKGHRQPQGRDGGHGARAAS
jgi:creatinine deaminase